MTRSKFFFAFEAAPLAAGAAPLTREALMQSRIVPGVSLVAVGPAKGHSVWDEDNQQCIPIFCDDITLQQVQQCCGAYANGLRVNDGHWSSVLEATGFLKNFRIDAGKLRGDWNLFETYSQFAHLCQLIVSLPDTFGLSIDFDGEPEIGTGANAGRAFARCTKIYTTDVVPTPAANEGGLFSASGLPPQVAQAAMRSYFGAVFDSAPTPKQPIAAKTTMTKPAATPPKPLTPGAILAAALRKSFAAKAAAPAAVDAGTAEDSSAGVPDEGQEPGAMEAGGLVDALSGAMTAAIKPVLDEIATFTQRLNDIEAAMKADDSAEEAMPAMKAMRKDFNELSAKLAKRMGLEFAARAGANPVENPAGANSGGAGAETRKAFEIPMAEKNAEAVRRLRGN